MTRRSTCRRRADRGCRAAPVRTGRNRPLRRRLPGLQRRGGDCRRHGRRRPIERDGHLSGISSGLQRSRPRMGGLQPSDLIVLAGRPGMGKTSLATNIAFNVAHAYEPEAGRRLVQGRERRRRRLLLARNVVRAARHAYHLRADRRPSSKIRRGDITEADFEKLVGFSQTMQKTRSISTRPAVSRSPSCRPAPAA
jgi:replicative DNA helicase